MSAEKEMTGNAVTHPVIGYPQKDNCYLPPTTILLTVL
jgi:hypothetical protein